MHAWETSVPFAVVQIVNSSTQGIWPTKLVAHPWRVDEVGVERMRNAASTGRRRAVCDRFGAMKRAFFFLLTTVTSLKAATIAHYKFENTAPNAPLYELTDSSGNGHHGRVLGQELLELTTDIPPYPGVTGGALDLRGRLDYAVIPHHSDFAPSGDWTIEFLIKVGHFHQESGGATNLAPGSFYPSVNTNLAYTILYKQNTNQ